jgi:hypothetical protein
LIFSTKFEGNIPSFPRYLPFHQGPISFIISIVEPAGKIRSPSTLDVQSDIARHNFGWLSELPDAEQ